MHSMLIAAILLVAYCEAKPRFDSGYIVGGEDAELGEFPWQVSVQYYNSRYSFWRHSCGGSLLSEIYVLTAAHCVTFGHFRVLAGIIHNRAEGTVNTQTNVLKIKTHELYRKRPEVYESDDIAIITLKSPIYANGNTIQYAKLPENNDDFFIGQAGYITGWGYERPNDVDYSYMLKKARISVVDKDLCNQRLPEFDPKFKVDDTQVCLYDPGQITRSCWGDDGGPLNLDNESEQTFVAGLSSWGPTDWNGCFTGAPVVYTRVSAYLPWIKANTP